MSCIEGKKVLVTRPKNQAGRLADELSAKGAVPLLLPATEIVEPEDFGPLDLALNHLDEFDWVVFTSANGVRAVAERMQTLEIPNQRMASRKLAVVGPSTGEVVEAQWRAPDAMPAEFVAEAIAGVLGNLQGQRVLLPRGDLARPELPDDLAARGATVLDVTAYRFVRETEEIDKDHLERPDVITMTSGESVHATIQRLQDSGLEEWLRTVPIACIGPLTAEAVREEGYSPATVASIHTLQGLIEAIEELFAVGIPYA